jgi:hypothetical protein
VASEQHAVEHGHADGRFGSLAGQATRPQAGADDGLVAAHRRFNQSASPIAGLVLPAQPPSGCYRGNVLVPLGRVVLGLITEYCRHRGWDDHRDVVAVSGHHVIGQRSFSPKATLAVCP